jgi:hypothetical protein
MVARDLVEANLTSEIVYGVEYSLLYTCTYRVSTGFITLYGLKAQAI